jgi:hypothetical protein
MEPFRLTAQSMAFVAVMAAVALIVAFAAPFGSIALGAAALAAIGAVLVKAMLRTRRWWPLTAVEGTVALSGLVLVVGAVAVVAYSMVRLGDGWHMTIGWPSVAGSPRMGSTTRSVSYSDPRMQQRLKDGLRAAGVPFTVKTQDGREFVGWDTEHAAAAQAVDEKIKEGPLPSGRNVHFPDAGLQKQFTDWLGEKGIKHEVVNAEGKDYILWHAGAGDAVRDFMESRGSAECKGRVAAGKGSGPPC